MTWPAPDPNGSTTLSTDKLRQVQALLNALVNYLQVQLERCEVR